MADTLLTLDAPNWWTSVSSTGSLIGPAYREDGYIVSDAGGGQLVDPSVRFPMSEGPYLLAGTPRLAREDGGTFGVTTLDLDLPYSGGFVTVIGKTAWGDELRYFTGADNAPFVWQDLTLPEEFSHGLVSLEIRSSGSNAAIDTIWTRPAMLFSGTAGADMLNGTAGNDEIHASAGRDALNGGAGDDILDGGSGFDRMAGGTGNDVYFVDSLLDRVTERPGEGTDLVVAQGSFILPAEVENLRLTGTDAALGTGNGLDNTMQGNDGANLLLGLGGSDTLLGGGGIDRLLGGSGSDLLDGQGDYDYLTGGGGGDTFRFTGVISGNLDMGAILDFAPGQGDLIQLVGLDAVTFIGTADFVPIDEYGQGDFGQFRYEKDGRGLRLEGDQSGDGVADWSLTVYGVSSLELANFA